jgi:hypothetical protein
MRISQTMSSTLIWIPDHEVRASDYLLRESRLLQEELTVYEPRTRNLVLRLLQADGASVISRSGVVLANGAIVDLSRMPEGGRGLAGTGTTAAQVLGTAGTSIKVSKDGTVKIFSRHFSKPLVF